MELNLRRTKKDGKKIFRYAYFGLDGRVKYISNKSKSALEILARKKIQEIGVLKTSSSQIFLHEAWQQLHQNLTKRKLDYLNGRKVKKISDSTIKDYTSFYINHINKQIGNVDLRLLDSKKLNEFVSYLINNDKVDNGTKRKIYNVLSLIIQHQVNPPQERLSKNICKDKDFLVGVQVTKPENTPMIDFNKWSVDFVNKLINDIERPMVKLICKILLETAARPSEIRALDRGSLLFQENIPMILINKAVKRGKVIGNTKTENGVRALTISTKLKDEIVEYVNSLPINQDQLFLNSKGKYICVEQIISHIDSTCAKNRVQLPIKRKSYFFRHYTATYWAYTKKHKENAIELARDLGDQDINFVNETYIKRYKGSGNTPENLEYQNKHFN